MPEPGFVTIIHPGLPGQPTADVPQTSLGQHYLAGWRLLTDEEAAAEAAPVPEPKPMTKAQAAKAAKAAKAESEE